MKKSLLLIFLAPLILSCTQNKNKAASEESIRKEVIDAAVKYASGKYKSAKETIARDGIISVIDNKVNFVSIASNQARYIIDPSKIVTGLINDDQDEDAIISIISVNEQNMESPENLIFIKADGKFMLNRVIESNMKVLEIKDRVITAEVSTRSLNSPLRDCHICKEVVKYRFRSGDLIRVN
jgi:hypothetical protein